MLRYSTELEEIAYSKDAEALLKNAEFVIRPEELGPGKREEAFYAAGVKFAAAFDQPEPEGLLDEQAPRRWHSNAKDFDVWYFTWHGDGKTYLFFSGEAKRKVRKLSDRPAPNLYR